MIDGAIEIANHQNLIRSTSSCVSRSFGDCPETWGIGRGKRALEPRFGCARRVGMAACPN